MHLSAAALKKIKHLVGAANVHTDAVSLALNSYDCSPSRHRPDAVLTITQAAQLPPLLALLSQEKIPFITRAGATNHAGSCTAVLGGVILNLNLLRQIDFVDTLHGFAQVDPGVITAQLQRVLQPLGFFYAPDPASENVCTLGGNLAQNASGARCMKYANTCDNTLQADFVLPSGRCLTLRHDDPGPDWLGLIAGSEGSLGLIQKLRVKILPCPAQIQTFLVAFPSLADSIEAVTDFVAHGLTPRCVEAMDKLTVQTLENFAHVGFPVAEALLLIELDGTAKQIQQDQAVLQSICQAHHSLSFTEPQDAAQRENWWRARRAAYAAMSALAPNVAVADGTVPRSQLPDALQQVRKIVDDCAVKACLLFHAGDGNFHPQLMFDARNSIQTRQVHMALQAILKTCVDHGGTISGEHGIGVEKRALMAYQYSRQTLGLFQKIKHAFDPFNLANPAKIIPVNFVEKAPDKAPACAATAALQQQLQQHHRLQQPFFITGSGTAVAPLKNQPCVCSATLNKIIEIDKKNYTATVQAGVRVVDLCQALRAQKVYAFLPADYPGTIGGLIATKAAPDFISQLTGIEAILSNGDLVQYGGKIMKNAAGYNLCRLFAGSWGALGLITQVTFRVYAAPQKPLSYHIHIPQADELFQAVKKEIDPDGLLLGPVFKQEAV